MDSQKQEMLQIHEELYQFLKELHDQDPSILFTMRKSNRSNRLEEGYWFLGNDKYLQVSFWDGIDVYQKISRIGFFVEKRREGWVSNVYFTCKDRPDLDSFFDDLSLKIGNFVPRSKHLWKKEYAGFDYLNNLRSFIYNDKVIIDEIVSDNVKSPINDININDFKKNISKVMHYRKR